MYPHGRNGADLIARLEEAVRAHPAITVFTSAEVMNKSGSFGNYQVTIAVHGERLETITVDVGSIVVATGFDTYEPAAAEFGYGMDGVVTLPEFKKMVDESAGPLEYNGRPVKTIAYVYCVGSRQGEDVEGGHTYCSRYCCTAAVDAALEAAAKGDPALRQYHLYRDMRTYGKYELLWAESREKGSLYLRVPEDEPPAVEKLPSGGLKVTTRDLLTGGEEVAIPADLVVLVTGMVPRENGELVERAQAPGRQRWLLQRDPPQAPPGRDDRRRRPHLRRLPVAQELGRERRQRPRRRHPERRHAQARLRRARPDGGDRRRRRLHVVRQVPRGLSLRRHRSRSSRRARRSPTSSRPPARAAAPACRCVPSTRSICRATPTPRSKP